MNFIYRMALERLCEIHRLHRKLPGRWRLTNWLDSRRKVLQELPPRPRKIWRGTYLFLDPHDYYDSNKYLVHGLNPSEPIANTICQLLRPGDCMLDIGANVGCFSALGSVLVGEKGAVHAFEALPETYERLKVLERRNRFGNVKARNIAVSEKDGFVEIFPGPPEHSGIASLRKTRDHNPSGVRVPATTIDGLAGEIPRVRLVKVDVEGAEMMVMRGMDRLIERDHPFVIAELTDKYLRDLGSKKEEVVQYFEARNYTIYRIGKSITKYTPSTEFQCDILCVPPGESSIGFKDDISLPTQ